MRQAEVARTGAGLLAVHCDLPNPGCLSFRTLRTPLSICGRNLEWEGFESHNLHGVVGMTTFSQFRCCISLAFPNLGKCRCSNPSLNRENVHISSCRGEEARLSDAIREP